MNRVYAAKPIARECARRTRYKTEESARSHWRAKNGGKVPTFCEGCRGYHLNEKPVTP